MRRATLWTLGLMGLTAAGIIGLGGLPQRESRATVLPVAGSLGAVACGGGFSGDDQTAIPVGRVYVAEEPTAEAAATWALLRKKLAFPFQNETPLEDVLNYIRSATERPNADGEAKDADAAPKDEPPGKKRPHGLQFYVSPVGLQEAEKTMQSACQLNLEDIPIATGLKLILQQHGLEFHVQSDGLIIIDAKGTDRVDDHAAGPHILNELSQLRGEINLLRNELRIRTARPGRPEQAKAGGAE